jgi:hypothetical protein
MRLERKRRPKYMNKHIIADDTTRLALCGERIERWDFCYRIKNNTLDTTVDTCPLCIDMAFINGVDINENI